MPNDFAWNFNEKYLTEPIRKQTCCWSRDSVYNTSSIDGSKWACNMDLTF